MFSAIFRRFFVVCGALVFVCGVRAQSSACAECHPKIARTYSQTGMSRAFYKPTAETVPATRYFHQPSATWYATLARDGKFYLRRWRVVSGREVFVQELQIDYVMGSGNHARSFLHRTPRGGLIELPLTWYAENGGGWAMSPGQDREYLQPARAIAYECMFCHNAYPRIPSGHDEPGAEALYSGELPVGIDCQRCHGSGAEHIRAVKAGASLAAVRGAIVNPARLPAGRQMEVCMQCHLETTSMPLPHAIVRYGRAPFSYRPGEPLGNFEISFDRAASAGRQDDFEIAHSAYRLRKSQCFLRSAGKLTCTTCHNPHDIPRGAAAVQHYNAVCATCHAATPKHAASPDCTGCHMPKRRTQDVVHTVMTDHWIQRRAPADPLAPIAEDPLAGENSYHGEVVPYYPSPLPQSAENALYVAVAQVMQRSNVEKGLPELAAEIARQKPARPEFYIELGQAWLGLHQPANAIAAFEEAVKREPDSAVALLNLGDALTEAGQPARAITVLNHAVQAVPTEPLLWYQLGIAHTASDNTAAAIAAFEKAAALDPESADVHNQLCDALAASGDLNRAVEEVMTALRINPDLPEALGNLGHLMAALGNPAAAIQPLERSVKLRPRDADVRTNYALALAELNRTDEALSQIDAALATAPSSADSHNVRAVLLEREGRADDALKEFLEAIRLRPGFGRAHLGAARILAVKGDRASAEAHLQAAAQDSDPAVQRQALSALENLRRR